ncbi:hypothetical protein EDC56_2938 [Sinobacterium caligoides]|uniref:SmpA/OmlA family protein n=1 Tax=Sinobacterium caligoides TaxID=933926 RepID=A0A3N2DKQ4_9GAMM|nr:phosphodiesterase [Sinobacterium caligoides]ROS00292.1 hypothetical protein EDC56_2938 [Sinobacterium caligoides]
MNTLRCYCAIFTLLLCGAPHADNIIIPIASQGTENEQLPVRAMSNTDVLRLYGKPNSQSPATGTPPITRWDYDTFTVVFEYDHVVHSVRKFHATNTPSHTTVQ